MRPAPSRLIIDSIDLGAGVGLRNVLLLDDLDARHLLERLDGDRMRLVPAEVVARADIDDADGEIGGERAARSGPKPAAKPSAPPAVPCKNPRREMK